MTIDRLEEIHFGAEYHPTGPVLGSRHFVKDMGFNYASTFLAHEYFRKCVGNSEIGTYILLEYIPLLHHVLSNTGFDKRIVHLNMRNLPHTWGWSVPKVWAYLDHTSILKLNIFDIHHTPPPEITMTPSTMSLDPQLRELILATTMSISHLRLGGCQSAYICADDTETLSLLANTEFPGLRRVELIDYAITSEQLIAFLQRLGPTVLFVYFTRMHLTYGSWVSVLRKIRGIGGVRRFEGKTLSEMVKRADGSFEKLEVFHQCW